MTSPSFIRTVGLDITVSTVSAEAEFKGVGGSVAVTLSQEWGWTTTRDVEVGRCTSSGGEFDVRPGYVGQVVSAREGFVTRTASGNPIGS